MVFVQLYRLRFGGLLAWLAAAALLACMITPNPAAASPQSVALTAEGVALMNANKPTEALVKFRAAGEADIKDPEPYFQTGILLNRTGRWVGAFGALNVAAARGSKNPELLFERGKALLGAKIPGRAILDLAAYDKVKPGRAATTELIGKAFSMKGDFASAEAAFAETLKREPKAAPMIAVYRAQIADARGDKTKAATELNTLLRDYPQSPAGRAVRERMAQMAPPQKPAGAAIKPLAFIAGMSFGDNNNVIGIGDGVPLPADISDESSHFARAEIGMAYTQRPTDRDVITLSYTGQFDHYFNLSRFDQQVHTVAVDISRLLRPKLVGTLRGSADFAFVDEDYFLSRPSVRGGFIYRWDNGHFTEGAISAAQSTYDFTIPTPALDRDGQSFSGSVTHYAPLAQRVRLRLGGFSAFNHSNGPDYVYWSLGAQAGVQAALPAGFMADVGGGYNRDDYDNANSFTGFLTTREDDAWRAQASLSHPVTKQVDIVARYSEVWNDSNIRVFNYDQRTISIGAVGRF